MQYETCLYKFGLNILIERFFVTYFSYLEEWDSLYIFQWLHPGVEISTKSIKSKIILLKKKCKARIKIYPVNRYYFSFIEHKTFKLSFWHDKDSNPFELLESIKPWKESK